MAKKPVAQTELDDVLERQREKAKVAQAIKAIRQAHADGRESRKEHGRRLYGSGDATIPRFAAKKGQRRDVIERARQFADIFDQQAVDKLCSECREHNFPLGVSMIYRVLPLGNVDKCLRLLQRAIRGRWTVRQMIAEIHKRPGAISRSGRPRVLPANSTEACQQIVIRFWPGVRWLKELKSSLDGKLDGSLMGKIEKAVIALDALVKESS